VTRYFLNRWASFCQTPDGIIFLNLRSNRYLGLGHLEARVLPAFVPDWPATAADTAAVVEYPPEHRVSSLLESLQTKGILTLRQADGRPAIQVSVRLNHELHVTAMDRDVPGTGVRHLLRFCLSLATVTLLLKVSNLDAIVSRLVRRNEKLRRRARVVPPGRVRELVGAFKSMRLWVYTTANECLFDSLVISTFLQRCGVPVTFVIGVSTRPFAAHAWAQHEDTVLNDTLERTDGFVPIVAS
jgi:hypothetical protein